MFANRFKLSRRGKKLQISEDQKILVALPKDVPERTWLLHLLLSRAFRLL